MRPLSSVLLLSSLLFGQVPAVVETTPNAAAGGEALSLEVARRIANEGIGNSQVMRILRDLCGKVGHRLTGSDNFTKACSWAATEFHAMGVPVVTLEKWGEWKLAWNRGAWSGRITSPVDLELAVATEAWTAGTNGPRTGYLAMLPKTVEEVDAKSVGGKWVFYSRRPSRDLRAACEKLGILGWVYRAGDPNDQFPNRMRVFGNNQTAMKPFDQVPKVPEVAVRADQADQIKAMLEEGKQVMASFDIDNTFRDQPIPLYNVIASIPGSEKPDEVVIVSAHLDSWHQAQGTTDNGTGSATTLEAARILMAIGAKPKRTIRFCLWGGEEQGLLGSRAYVQRHRTEMEKVSAVFNHDTGTNWAQGLGVTQAMADQLGPVFAHVNSLLKAPDASWTDPVFDLRVVPRVAGGGGSDHASFIAAGVPGLDWSLKGRSNYFNHTWHTQWDRIEVAIEEYQRHTATVIAMAALGTANLPDLLDRKGVDTGASRTNQSAAFAASFFEAELDDLTFTLVKEGGRAAKMGVQKGDVLKTVGGQEVERVRQIFQFAREVEGDTIAFTFARGTTTFEAKVKKEELPAAPQRPAGGGNQGPRDTVPPAVPVTPPAGGGQSGSSGGGGGGEDLELVDGGAGELRWGVGLSTPAGVQAQVTFSRRDVEFSISR
ncbi:MAG: M20/M25/M40 family metallo-hydrolase [Planctomycetes bacterium]|nr:M20/M25/M40 family metallo-hydrolase [Planctomycetota bacterium]